MVDTVNSLCRLETETETEFGDQLMLLTDNYLLLMAHTVKITKNIHFYHWALLHTPS